MKIAFFELEDWEQEYFQNGLGDFELVFSPKRLDEETVSLAASADIISIFTVSRVTKELLAKLPSVKMIAVRATGFDNIDVAAAGAQSVAVCNVPTYGENTVAEHTFGLILNLSRKIYKSIEAVRERGFVPNGLRGFDLKGKTLGIVGMGHIGANVARIARGFEMNVIATDPKEDKKLAKKLNFSYVLLEDLLKNSDIITIHAPLNEHTRHLINSQNIYLVKRGAYLINTARGDIVETGALARALNEGILAGAGLDVLEGEHAIKEERELLQKEITGNIDFKTLLQNHILMEHDNVIITPHNAFNSKEALERIMQTTIDNIQTFKRGKTINTIS